MYSSRLLINLNSRIICITKCTMPQSVRDGLATLNNSLVRLANDSQDLERARNRFDRTPSPLLSPEPLSGTTTRSQTPDAPLDEQQREARKERQEHKERLFQLRRHHSNSMPLYQFQDLVEDEKVHLWMSEPQLAWTGEQGIR